MFWYFFFFKQKTAYEMRISDWSSDVCSSDLFCYIPLGSGECGVGVEADRAGHVIAKALGGSGRGPGQVEAGKDFNIFPQNGAANNREMKARELQVRKIGRASCRERVCQYV